MLRLRLVAPTVVLSICSLLPGAASAAGPVAASGATYTISGLPTPAGMAFAVPTSLSDQGEVSGILTDANQTTHAAVWNGRRRLQH
jgi:hypothetical protein